MNKRKKLDCLSLDTIHLYKLMRRLFPKANNYRPFDGAELVEEFHRFGVSYRKFADERDGIPQSPLR